MEAINRNEISNDTCPQARGNTLSLLSILEHPFTFLNTKFNFAGGKLCYKTEKKKEFENVDMIVYLTEGRQFAGK